jgi:hypothetical protein
VRRGGNPCWHVRATRAHHQVKAIRILQFLRSVRVAPPTPTPHTGSITKAKPHPWRLTGGAAQMRSGEQVCCLTC